MELADTFEKRQSIKSFLQRNKEQHNEIRKGLFGRGSSGRAQAYGTRFFVMFQSKVFARLFSKSRRILKAKVFARLFSKSRRFFLAKSVPHR